MQARTKNLVPLFESTIMTKSKASAQAPRLFADFRQMFDEMARDIDAVIVSTPDHTHFVAAMWALKHRKHICVQKPLCNTIWEVRELHRAAKAAGVVTQMGNQGRTSEGHRLAKEWIEQGVIGTLKEIRLWTNRPIWPQGPMNKKSVACPPNLNWDLWLASEPDEPYFEFDVPEGQSGKARKAGQLEWASSIVNGGKTSSGFDYSAPLSEFVQLGNLAIRSGQTIQWDAAPMRVTNVAAANRFIKRFVYRQGWL